MLNDRFRVTVMDLPGFGNSGSIKDASMDLFAEEVNRVVISAGIDKCVLIGHSMGGYTALAYAKKFGTSLLGMGLLHSTANADSEERKLKRDQAIRVIEEKGYEAYINNFIPPLFSPSFQDKGAINKILKEGLRTSAEGLKNALSAMKTRPDSNDWIASTRLPLLFVSGKEDGIIPESDLIRQAALAQQSMLISLKHSGHMGMIEEPETCAKTISEFMEYCYP